MADLIENGRITSADIIFSRGFALDCWVQIEFDGTGQGFGGYVLGGNPFDTSAVCARHETQKNLAADFIGGVMAVADVDAFSKLPGKVIRVRRESPMGLIVAIGHPFKERWYEPKNRFELLAANPPHATKNTPQTGTEIEDGRHHRRTDRQGTRGG